jgi:hypothetical protein
MAKRIYATQLAPGMVLSSGFEVACTIRHALDEPGKVKVFTPAQPGDEDYQPGDVWIDTIPNDDKVPDGGVLPPGKVRVKFTDDVVRDWGEDTRIKVTE